MDGKTGAEDLIARALNDPTLLQALVSAPKPEGEESGSKDEE
jgi:type VI secretion system protein ImpB